MRGHGPRTQDVGFPCSWLCAATGRALRTLDFLLVGCARSRAAHSGRWISFWLVVRGHGRALRTLDFLLVGCARSRAAHSGRWIFLRFWANKKPFSTISGKRLNYAENKGFSYGTGGGDRTRTPKGQQILSLSRLPFRHSGIERISSKLHQQSEISNFIVKNNSRVSRLQPCTSRH